MAGQSPRLIIENLPGSHENFELIEGRVTLEHVMPGNIVWPGYYGSLEKTIAPDGDPVDMFMFSDIQVARGALVAVKVLDIVWFTDRGKEDHTLLGVMADGLIQGDYDVAAMQTAAESFLVDYKSHKGTPYEMLGLGGPAMALEYIQASQERYEAEEKHL